VTPLAKRSQSLIWITVLSIFFVLSPRVFSQIGLRLPDIDLSLAPLVIRQQPVPPSVGYPLSQQPIRFPRLFQHSVSLESTGQFITAAQRLKQRNILPPSRLTLSDYIRQRGLLDAQNQWIEFARTHVTPSQSQRRSAGIRLETGKIKSKAFQQIFGGETLSLNVTGNITIDGNMRNEKRSSKRTATNRAPQTSFQMKQTQRLLVEGKIGENVSVLVDQDSERPFDFENAIKLKYTSEEDGIVQKIEAGNINLSLPGTQFVTFNSQNSGLFGIKALMKVGKLDITAIASMEKGKKNRKTFSGGKEESINRIYDYQYKRGIYYFLDMFFREQFTNLNENGVHQYDPDSALSQIEVYISRSNTQEDESAKEAWAVLNPDTPDFSKTHDESVRRHFVRLEPIQEYYVHMELGYIVLKTAMREGEVLATAYKDASWKEYGTLLETASGEPDTIIFKLIRPKSPRPSDETWNLEWKNVYSLGGSDIKKDGLDVRIYYKPPSGIPQDTLGAQSLLSLFGLDNRNNESGAAGPDDVIDINENILNLSRGELIFPNLRPFYPVAGIDSSNLPVDKWAKAIYDTTVESARTQASKFYLEVKSSARKSQYDLGMNVIEGTEEIRLDGTLLIKDVDYRIDYFSGTLDILKETALLPNAELDISYESQQMFSIDKKSLMGIRAEYTLWETGSHRSFIGGTLLHLSQSTIDKRVRIGKDAPMKNLVWDVNASLRFQPDFLTSGLNALPLLNLSAPSTISIEGEFAQVIPNPNTLNSKSTGDHDGVAYIDDFEGAKKEVPLSVLRTAWSPAYPPTTVDKHSTELYLKRKAHLFWYNPIGMVPIQDIWPDKEVTNNFGGSTHTHILVFHFNPNNTDGDPTQSWAGVQRALSTGYADQTESRFLEVWVNVIDASGNLHIDLGRVPEDVIPNLKLNTEDKLRGGIREGVLHGDEDSGIDGVFGPDPPTLFAIHQDSYIKVNDNGEPEASLYDFWDLNGDSTKQENEPWSYDDWDYETNGPYNDINGTENNSKDGALRKPDTEDLNNNADIDINNDYFSYSFSLDQSHPDTMYIAGGKTNPKGWRLYRIPLNAPEPVRKVFGQPNWSRIEFTRVWLDGIDKEIEIEIAAINLTGNEWKVQGVAFKDSTQFSASSDSTITISAINTHDNPEYESPPGVKGLVDPVQKIRAKEQSLLLNIIDLDPEYMAIAHKQFYSAENLIYYKSLKMFVHGGDYTHRFLSENDSIEFFLQWGSDNDYLNYYEVRLPVAEGWAKSNNIEVLFEDLSRLKVEKESLGLDSTYSDTLANGHIISVAGIPSLTNVRWLRVGVVNKGLLPFTGQVWINELRVSNVQKEKAIAMRVSSKIQLSDFISISGDYRRKDADFHTVNERFGKGSNSQSGGISANIKMDKLLPASWGISIPVSMNYSKSLSTPKYKPGSDIFVSPKTMPDSLLRRIQTGSKKRGVSLSFSKRSKSRNFWVRYLVDPITGSLSYSESDQSSSMIKFSNQITYTGSFKYGLNLGDQNYFTPFKWLGLKGFFKKVAALRFYYLPSRFNYNLTGKDGRLDKETSGGVLTQTSTANFSRGFQVTYVPFKNVNFDFSNTKQCDMREGKWTDLISSLNPGVPIGVTQMIKTQFKPKMPWLNPSFSYTANYKWADNIQTRDQGTSQSSSINTTFTISGKLSPKEILKSFKKKRGASTNRRSRAPVSRPAQGQQDEEQEPEQKKKPFPLLKFFTYMGKAFEKIDPISINMTNTQTGTHRGIKGMPSLSYQIGSTLDHGLDYHENATPTQRETINKKNGYSAKSGIKVTRDIGISFDYKHASSENESTQKTGSITHSSLDKHTPFPSWTVQWRGLEKVPFVNKFMRTISLSHSFSGETTEKWKYIDDTKTKTEVSSSKNFRPFLGISMTMKNGITTNIQYAITESLQESKGYSKGKSLRVTSDLSVTAKYARRGGIKLPFLKKKLDNNIDFSLTFKKGSNATYSTTNADDKFNKSNRRNFTKNWTLQPSITYSFTRTVNGGIRFEFGNRYDLITGNTKISAFGVNAKISLGG